VPPWHPRLGMRKRATHDEFRANLIRNALSHTQRAFTYARSHIHGPLTSQGVLPPRTALAGRLSYMPSARPNSSARDDSDARRSVRILSWLAVATGVLGLVLVIWTSLLPLGGPWVQLALGILTLIFAFRARRIGSISIEEYDGRLSLLAALMGFPVVFFAGQAAFILLAAGPVK